MTDFDYDTLAHDSLRLFVEAVSTAISGKKYDLILAGGDSGNIMAWITNAIYDEKGLSAPQTIVLPTYRHADYAETVLFDNRILKPQLILPPKRLENILIVDDEVEVGNTINGLLQTLAEVTQDKPKVTFIAEDDGFDASKIAGWDITFMPPQQKVKDVFNAVSYIVPYWEYQVPVKKVLEPLFVDMNDKHVMAALLNLPIKQWNDGKPEFTFVFRDECMEKIDNFAEMQQNFQAFVRANITKALS